MEAGVGVWGALMRKIGREKNEEETRGCFADLMLKEWARVFLGDQTKVCPFDFLDATWQCSSADLEEEQTCRIF